VARLIPGPFFHALPCPLHSRKFPPSGRVRVIIAPASRDEKTPCEKSFALRRPMSFR
jgi:hypothetical protein